MAISRATSTRCASSSAPRCGKLAFVTLNHGHVRALRHRVLAELVDEVQETCNFTTLDGTDVLYLDRVEARWPLRLTLDVGAHVPIHCTASGKLFLAHLPPPQFDELVAPVRLQSYTPNTIASAVRLRHECEAIRAAGYSTDREEFIAGLVAVAVPVYGSDNVLRAGDRDAMRPRPGCRWMTRWRACRAW